VNGVVQGLLAKVQAILGDAFTGMYLYGSLAQGDFDSNTSDIDVIVVTEREVSDEQFALLGEMHAAFRASDSYWAESIEAAYIRKDALDLPPSHPAEYPQLEKGRDLVREPLEEGWPFQRSVLRNQGIVVAGPDPATLMAPVSAQELSDAATASIRMCQQTRRTDPSWLEWVRQPPEQRFVVVTLCRCLYTLEHGTVASKSAAAAWGQDTLDRRWAALISRSAMQPDGMDAVTDEELADTLAFLDYTAARLADSSDRG
jgi:predicted nucleotidyltransferase